MIVNKGKFVAGMILMVAFLVVLVAMFMPLFGQKNGLQYLDDLYNSISKGSAYYIPKVQKEIQAMDKTDVRVELAMENPELAQNAAKLFNAAGALVNTSGTTLTVNGDLGRILDTMLSDADALYFNRGEELKNKYGMEGRLALYSWWQVSQSMDKALKAQEAFKAAKMVELVKSKAVETSYNYYGIQPQKITERMGVVIFSLIFYVAYTLWYGFGIMFLFEGVGMRLEH